MPRKNVIQMGKHDHEQRAHIFLKKIKIIHRIIEDNIIP
jgi:hypothetical protein